MKKNGRQQKFNHQVYQDVPKRPAAVIAAQVIVVSAESQGLIKGMNTFIENYMRKKMK